MTRASDLAKLLGAGATINDGTTITTADNTVQLSLTSTDADENSGPQIDLYRNSASPADNDLLGRIVFYGENDADEKIEYGNLQFRNTDASDGTEDATVLLIKQHGGSAIQVFGSNATETVFNDNSVDIDFRVEGSGVANALVVEGSSGNVGIGTNSPDTKIQIKGSTNSDQLTLGGTDNRGLKISTTNVGGQNDSSVIFDAQDTEGSAANSTLIFSTGGTERARIGTSAIVFNEGSNDVDFRVEGNGDANLFICDAGNDDVYIHRNNSTINSTNRGTVFNSGDGVSSFKTSADAASDEVAVQFYGTAGKCFIYGNGNVNNDNGTFGNFSDQTLKENIVDAQSQWADIKALQIRNFNLISNPNLTQLGVVAQELEASGMNGLVEDLIIDDEKNTKKAVKTSVLYMKAVKALQEAMTRIETLEAKVTTLENA